jgi:hypothetical protein
VFLGQYCQPFVWGRRGEKHAFLKLMFHYQSPLAFGLNPHWHRSFHPAAPHHVLHYDLSGMISRGSIARRLGAPVRSAPADQQMDAE